MRLICLTLNAFKRIYPPKPLGRLVHIKSIVYPYIKNGGDYAGMVLKLFHFLTSVTTTYTRNNDY